jgi:hypothetical protein
VRWALTRRPCVASPGAIAFAGGEAPRRYYSRASGAALRLLPTRASMGTVLIQPTEIRRHRGEWPPTRPRRAGPIGRSGRPPVGVQASGGVFLVAVARYGARIKSVDLVICCPSRNSISRFAAGMARAYAASPWRQLNWVPLICERATSGWRRGSHRWRIEAAPSARVDKHSRADLKIGDLDPETDTP